MAAAATAPATPQRPLPGGFINTPAPQAPTIFAANAATLRQNAQVPAPDPANVASKPVQGKSLVERAAQTINEALAQEGRFPELDNYVGQGVSSECEIPKNPALMPFQKLKDYLVPPRLLEQLSYAGMETHMGIMPQIGHAWLTLDNCLYLWDYTLPNPDLIGWEESSNPISTIKLGRPRPGVFINEIEHVIVVVTSVDMILLGVAVQTSPTGAKTVQLYNTRMSISVRGLAVNLIECTMGGRVFFTGSTSDDIYEFQYQQDEGWFRGRTNRKCHTKGGMAFMNENTKAITSLFSGPASKKVITSLVVDSSRRLLYTLSSTNEMKVWLLKADLVPSIGRTYGSLLQQFGHFSPRSELLTGSNVSLVSISPVPSMESNRLSLVATTSTGCRLYLSLSRGYGFPADMNNPPTSFQIVHIRFPPSDPNATAPPQNAQPTANNYSNLMAGVNATSEYLKPTIRATRIPPGYFMAVCEHTNAVDRLFAAAPDTARIKNPQDTTQVNQRFAELGAAIDLPGLFYEAMSMTTDTFGAVNSPQGFGNELATQFDHPSADIAFVTSGGIRVIRRRRLVDMFAAMMKYGSSDDEGREGDIKRFVRTYGRGETAATSLAVACGQGVDVSPDSRLTNMTDPEVLEGARQAFIEHGGKPELNSNAIPDTSGSQIDSVRPSPRHEGMALYISRLVRSIWEQPVIKQTNSPADGPKVVSTVKLEKLRSVQRDLNSLSEFLERNKSFIEGLAGPHTLSRATSRQEEIAMQGEHRAMNSLVSLVASIVEGISFALVLFDERLESIIDLLSDDNKAKLRQLNYQTLFVSTSGRELARELVKAIVNHNIANGSNVDTVAEALRRRCGSFCSADDVVIFKAQEQVKRAAEAGSQTETGRVLLNESQRLFQKVAASLSMEHLHWATERYVEMVFYAGAIQLCLIVAREKDRANRALTWLKDGMPDNDERKPAFEARKLCYDLVFATIEALDKETGASPSKNADDQVTIASRRRNEAYDIVNGSDDAVFQTCLYDWYVSIGQANRLLDIDTQYVVDYLKRRAQEDRAHADLLWRYHAHHNDYLQAASVQLDLARGFFDISLEQRIEYLSWARTNASTRQTTLLDSRQSKQQLLREISDLLDIANIQDDILQRMKSETRLTGERRDEVLRHLNGPMLPIDELFNQFADQAGYYDISLQIFQVADHRNPADIKSTWQNLIDQADDLAQAQQGRAAQPWEVVGERVRELGRRLNVNDATFPVVTLLPMLERYAMLPKETSPPRNWALDLFLDLDIPHETLLPVLEGLYYSNEHPFHGAKRRVIAAQMVYLLQSWFEESERSGQRVALGSEENASTVLDCLSSLLRGGDLDNDARIAAETVTAALSRAMR